jgi:hypothetical protein
MKTFLKVFATISLSLFAVISFIRFDVNVSDWEEGGRFAYTFFVLISSFTATAIIESEKTNK